MSAFLVSDECLSRIVNYIAAEHEAGNLRNPPMPVETHEERVKLFKRLYSMNVAAIHHRYGEVDAKEQVKHRRGSMEYNPSCGGSDHQILKSFGCYTYQCSEGRVPRRKLFKQIERIENSIAYGIATRTPEYDRATWG